MGYSIGNKTEFYGKIGITPSILLNAEIIVPENVRNQILMLEGALDVKNKLSKFDIGGLMELGAIFEIYNDLNMFSSISYRHGFTKITDSANFIDSQKTLYGYSIEIGLNKRINKK